MAKLYFTYAAMNAGKSTALLQSAFNYEERGMRTLLFTAGIDNRVREGQIASRIGLAQPARVFDPQTKLVKIVENETMSEPVACVFVDEAQFLSRQHVLDLCTIVDELSIPVMCYGLRTDFRGHLFDGAAWLLALADVMREMKSICHCGRKATMNLRVDASGNTVMEGKSIEIGGNDRYVALCRKHYFERFPKSAIR